MRPPEPALTAYFFRKAYTDLVATVRSGLARVSKAGEDHLSGSADDLRSPVAVVAFGLMVGAWGTVVVLGAVHAVAITLVAGLLWLAVAMTWLAERVVMLMRKLWMVCPRCHARLHLPYYVCDGPGCRAQHRRLLPGRHGVLHRRCGCGQRLPASFFANRGRLESICPECSGPLDRAHTEASKVHVAVVGGPSVGKTAYMHAALQRLIEEWAPAHGVHPRFIDPHEEALYRKWDAALARGELPAKTTDRAPPAFNLLLEQDTRSTLLYLHDLAGEAWHDLADLSVQRFQGFITGMVFLIDPFALPTLSSRYPSKTLLAVGAGASVLEDTLGYLLLGLESHHHLERKGRVRWPLAVVVGKVDALAPSDTLPIAVDRDESSAGIRQWLTQRGGGAFVSQVEQRFENVRYFDCSALGRIPDGHPAPFESIGVLEPIEWLVDTAGTTLDG